MDYVHSTPSTVLRTLYTKNKPVLFPYLSYAADPVHWVLALRERGAVPLWARDAQTWVTSQW
jgi:hypothetical protein